MYQELKSEYPDTFKIPKDGYLGGWAEQGVLLLNAALTVRAHAPNSHAGKGWEQLTDAVIKMVNDRKSNVVFMLWGSYAQKKGKGIDRKKHLVLTSTHPSPLSAHRGFLGCGHFKKANEYLVEHKKKPIDWMALDVSDGPSQS
ncbi:hypothetical protein EV182_007672 [Spiromyces aspiralis]|uniref:Uncharacterized protein n=1 Tax=Spiromyces aspiralis TaxID=68401 RepID=A0ACC1HJF5_9FUNG|nr:hypothetical protein EV182_007672 [Spiromyces aspiralis]